MWISSQSVAKYSLVLLMDECPECSTPLSVVIPFQNFEIHLKFVFCLFISFECYYEHFEFLEIVF
jgi:hypothetical protein